MLQEYIPWIIVNTIKDNSIISTLDEADNVYSASRTMPKENLFYSLFVLNPVLQKEVFMLL